MMKRIIGIAIGIEIIWLTSLRIQPWNRNVNLFLVLFFLAFALYLLSWWILRRSGSRVGEDPNTRRWIIGMIVTGGLLFRATVFFSPPSLSDDIYRYIWDGRVQLAGINPYELVPEDPALRQLRDETFESINHRSIKTIYPPLSQLVFRLCAAVYPNLTPVRLLFMGCDVALLILLGFYLRFKGLPLERLIIYAWNPLVIVEISSSGHLDSLAIILFVGTLFAGEAGRDRWSGVLAGLGFLAKFATILLLPWTMVKSRGRRAIPVIVAVIGIGYWIYAPEVISGISQSSGLVTYVRDWYFNASLYAILSTAAPSSETFIKICFSILAAIVGCFLAARFQDNEIVAYSGLMWALTLVLSPVVHPWYALGLVPFLCFYPRWSGLLFTGLVSLSYVVLREYSAFGIWRLPLWVPWVEYGVPALILLGEGWRALIRRSRAQGRSSSFNFFFRFSTDAGSAGTLHLARKALDRVANCRSNGPQALHMDK